MYILQREDSPGNWAPIGFYDSFPEAVCALEDERKKEDGISLKIVNEKGDENRRSPASVFR